MTTLAEAVGGSRRVIGGPFGSKLTTRDYVDTGVPVIRGGNMEHHGRWIGGEFAFVTEEKVERDLKTNLAFPGDIIVTQRGTLGQVSMVPDGLGHGRFVISQSQMAVSVDPKRAHPAYVYYYLRSPTFAEYSHHRTIQTGVPHINLGILRDAVTNFPSLSEQREIAATLGALDDKIEVNRRMAATLEEMARALYRSWFVDFDPVTARAQGRAPAHMGKTTAALFPDRFGDDGLPEGWEIGTLGDIARNRRDQVQPSAIDSETPYVGLEHMPRRSIAIGDWGVAGDVGSAKSRVGEGSLLFGKLRPYFHKVGLAPVDGICSTDILVVEPVEAVWSGLVLYVISSDAFVEHANATSSGTRMPRANWGDMARYEFAVPDRQIARAFGDLVTPMQERIVQSIHENRTLAALRDALLPKLMSGELRVREAEAQVAEAV